MEDGRRTTEEGRKEEGGRKKEGKKGAAERRSDEGKEGLTDGRRIGKGIWARAMDKGKLARANGPEQMGKS